VFRQEKRQQHRYQTVHEGMRTRSTTLGSFKWHMKDYSNVVFFPLQCNTD
jgi:hypothetical protein